VTFDVYFKEGDAVDAVRSDIFITGSYANALSLFREAVILEN
jgi:hypothetical protein